MADTYTTTDTTLLITGLPLATSYLLYVQSNCGGTIAAVSDTVAFSTGAVAPCNAPLVDSISTGEDYITVYFTPLSDSTELQLTHTDGTIGHIVTQAGTHTFGGLIHSTEYTLTLRALCGDNMSEWTTILVSTITVDCGTPARPILDDINFTNATVSWEPAADENAWGIRIFNNVHDDTVQCTATTYTFDNLDAGVAYNVQVQALCGIHSDIPGSWSEPLTFTTTTCQPVTNVTVSNIDSNSAIVSWTPGANGNGTWRVEYGLRGFSRGEGTTMLTADNPYTMLSLEANTSYDVYVATICDEGIFSIYSDSTGFTTSTTGIGSTDAEVFTISPNPTGGDVTISVGEPSTVSVVDMHGRIVVEPVTVHSQLVIHHSSLLLTGTYFVRLVNSLGITVRKLIVK